MHPLLRNRFFWCSSLQKLCAWPKNWFRGNVRVQPDEQTPRGLVTQRILLQDKKEIPTGLGTHPRLRSPVIFFYMFWPVVDSISHLCRRSSRRLLVVSYRLLFRMPSDDVYSTWNFTPIFIESSLFNAFYEYNTILKIYQPPHALLPPSSRSEFFPQYLL